MPICGVVEHLLLGECDSIHSHKLLAFLVAAPVSSGKRGNLHSLDGSRVGDVRSAAQIGESALCISRDMTVLQFADKLALVGLATVAEQLQSIRLADIGPDYSILLPRKLKHFLLDLGEFSCGDLMTVGIDVVIETVVNSRAYAEFNARIQHLESFGEKMRRTVPEGMFAFGVIPFEKPDGCVLFNGAGDVPFLTVD